MAKPPKDHLRKRWNYSAEWLALFEKDPAAAVAALNESPLQKASVRLEEHLAKAHLDPVVNASEQHSRLVWIFREILDAAHPGMTAEDMLLPVYDLLAQALGGAHGSTGGRKPAGNSDDPWLERFNGMKSRKPDLSDTAVFKNIAAMEAGKGNAVSWSTVRDRVKRASKKRNGKPPIT